MVSCGGKKLLSQEDGVEVWCFFVSMLYNVLFFTVRGEYLRVGHPQVLFLSCSSLTLGAKMVILLTPKKLLFLF